MSRLAPRAPTGRAPTGKAPAVTAALAALVLLLGAVALVSTRHSPVDSPADGVARDAAGGSSAPRAAASFRVSSFNVLGAGHTRAGGTRAGYAPGRVRMRWAVTLLGRADISVAGLQELELPQHAAFQRAAPAWGIFPGMRRTRRSLANSVVWRHHTWRLVEGHTIDVPYFHGRAKPMPYLLLEHRATGRRIWFANVHNPADARGPAGRWRHAAVARETALVNRLSARGTPVVLTGDMNDRAAFFCPVAARTRMHAANGGSRGGPCRPPQEMGIDWILGSPRVRFTHQHTVRGPLVSRTSDHPFVWASASVGGP